MKTIAASLLVALALATFVAPASPSAQAPPPAAPAPGSVEGLWKGQLLHLRVILRIEAAPDGSLRGTLDSPDQGATGLVADAVTLVENELHLDMRSIGAGFIGTLAADGGEISGTWKQGESSVPLVLRRSLAGAPDARKPQEPVPPLPYRAEEVAYANPRGRIRLAGTLTIPEGKGPFPAVLLVSGSGPQDRDEAVFGHKPFLVLSDFLTRRGIAVLRVDDRGVGGSTGSLPRSTLNDLADDALAGLAYLRVRSEIDSSRIGMIGHSEGGIVAPMAAVRSSGAVKFLVLLAGVGIPGEELLLRQSAMMARQQGAGPEAIERQDEIQARLYAVLKEPADSAAVAPRARAILAELVAGSVTEDQARAMGGREVIVDQQLTAVLSPAFRGLVRHDPRPTLRRVRCPVLALNGEKDTQVPARESLTGIETALRAGGNTDVTARTLPGLNHLFQTCQTGSVVEYATNEETFSPAALEEIAAWIEARTKAGP